MQDLMPEIEEKDSMTSEQEEQENAEALRVPAEVEELRVIETREINLSEERRFPQPRYFMESAYELPEGYGETRIVLQVRDPYWLHAYWEISRATFEEISERLGPDAWKESTRLLRVYDVTGVDLEGSQPSYSFDIQINNYANNWYINVERPNRSYCVDLGLKTRDGDFVWISRSNMVHTPRAGISEVVDEEWMTIEALERTYVGKPGPGPSSPEFARHFEEKREFLMGSEAVSSISSPGFAIPRKERGFWLVADTELIVYGATEPDASVTVGGHPVKLHPDGSFSLRLALPEGEHTLAIEARSSDGTMVRRITPVIKRTTLN